MVAVPLGMATSPLVAIDHPALRCRLQAVSRGAAVDKPKAHRHAVARQGGWVRGRSAAKRSAVAQRGKAFSRSPVSRAVPTRSAHCRGEPRLNCRQVYRRRAIADPKGSGSAWGAKPSAPKPQARETGSSLATHRPKPTCVQRVRLSRFPAPAAGAPVLEKHPRRPAGETPVPTSQEGERVWCAPAAQRLFVPPVRPRPQWGSNRFFARYTTS